MAKKNGRKQAKSAAKKTAKSKQGGKKGAAKSQGTNRDGSLAAIIDPMLLAGESTIQEIATALGKKAGKASEGRDLAANVRARMVSYTRKGWRVEKDDQKRVKVVQA